MARYSKAMHDRLVKAAREHPTITGAGKAAGVPERTLYFWRERYPELVADMAAAQEASRNEDFELARSVLRKSLKEMQAGERPPDYNLLRLTLARQDEAYAMQHRKTDMTVTGKVAIEQALAELDADR